MKQKMSGHLLALFCVIVWGSTFVVSKSLMAVLTPVQLMLLRFTLAYVALWIIHPKWYFCWREEWRFLLMAIFGNTLYCWAEVTALTITQASNVSILVSTAPIITALILAALRKDERLTRKQALGFGVAFFGVILVVFNGSITLKVQPVGDLLALLAAASWAVYGILLRRWSSLYDGVLITRKLMFYGALTTLPLVVAYGQPIDFSALLTLESVLKLAYLALVGSALCYILWNRAIQEIGVLSASLYIYVVPLVTLLLSAAILNERITAMGLAGIVIVISGMVFATVQEKYIKQVE
ncbi:MAG: DMT family transporter [Christensenellaceae bacterium]|nr:DMT family transporter [Christensenellaceae bacterium]